MSSPYKLNAELTQTALYIISIITLRNLTVVCCVMCKTQTTYIVNQSPLYWHLKQMTSVLLASILCGWSQRAEAEGRRELAHSGVLPSSAWGKWPGRCVHTACVSTLPVCPHCLCVHTACGSTLPALAGAAQLRASAIPAAAY